MAYAEFRKEISHKIIEKLEWQDMATFVPNKKLPIYNWFYYKEGFAKELVDKLIELFGIQKNATVLDPFCGSGTTLLACKENGINAIGYDVLPVSVFVSQVKTKNYDAERLRGGLKKITKTRFESFDIKGKFPHIFYRAFSRYALEDIAFLRHKILELDNNVRDFFVLALINSAIRCSYAYKDGSAIKIKRRPVAPLRKMFARTASRMVKDLEKCQINKDAQITAELNDARILPLDDNSVDTIITSPPYLNQIDYTKVYAIEEFFIHGDPMPGVRAYIGMKAKETDFLPELGLPQQARLYFEDMNEALKEMHRVLKAGGKAAVVVGNGYLPISKAYRGFQNTSYFENVDEVIESDIILSYMAQKIGFVVENIFVLNTRFALEGRTTKKGVLRESLIMLQKLH